MELPPKSTEHVSKRRLEQLWRAAVEGSHDGDIYELPINAVEYPWFGFDIKADLLAATIEPTPDRQKEIEADDEPSPEERERCINRLREIGSIDQSYIYWIETPRGLVFWAAHEWTNNEEFQVKDNRGPLLAFNEALKVQQSWTENWHCAESLPAAFISPPFLFS